MRKENTLRDGTGTRKERPERRKTHCYMGHEYTLDNTRVLNDRGHKSCKQCRRDREFIKGKRA